MLIHVVNNQTNTILDVERSRTLLSFYSKVLCWHCHSQWDLSETSLLKSPLLKHSSAFFSALLGLLLINILQGNPDDWWEQRAAEKPVQDVQRCGRPACCWWQTARRHHHTAGLQSPALLILADICRCLLILVLLSFLSFYLSQLVIIILAVLLCLAGILFVTMNWHYRRM